MGHNSHNQRVRRESERAGSATTDSPAADSWRAAFANRSLATAFADQAALYARLRPDYPAAAVALALPAGAARVLDLGAGTGKLTGAALARGTQVVAVEPLESMLEELHRRFPTALAVAGTAESIPLADSTVDAVVVGQAFHWFDPSRALPEIARVLRPGGTLCMLWNHDDDTDPLVLEVESALNRAGRPVGGSTGRAGATALAAEPAHPSNAAKYAGAATESVGTISSIYLESRVAPFAGDPALTDPALTEIAWTREQSVEDYLGLQQTYSYVIRAAAGVRAVLDAEVRAILQRHQPDNPAVRIPVTCQVWRSTCR